MADLGSLTVFLNADSKNYSVGMDRASRKTERFAAETKRANDIVKAGFAAAGIAVLEFGRRSILAAANAEETKSKFNTVFSEIGSSAENAARRLSSGFDIASSTAREMLGDTGDLLTGFGFTQKAALDLSTQVSTLAGDLASFQNIQGGAAEASRKLTKGILGETENLKSLGIVVNQTTPEFREQVAVIMDLTGATKQQAKAQVILNQAIKQSKNATGDYARTANSLSNVIKSNNEGFKEFSEGVGTLLISLPVLNGLLANSGTWLRQAGGGAKLVAQDLNRIVLGIDEVAEARNKELDTQTKKQKEVNKLTRERLHMVKIEMKTFMAFGADVRRKQLQVRIDAVKTERKERIDGERAAFALEKKNNKDLEVIRDNINTKFKNRMAEKAKLEKEKRKTERAEAISQFRSLPNFSQAITAGSQAALQLRTRGRRRGTIEEKMKKKNTDANIRSSKVLTDIAKNGVKMKDVIVVDNIARG